MDLKINRLMSWNLQGSPCAHWQEGTEPLEEVTMWRCVTLNYHGNDITIALCWKCLVLRMLNFKGSLTELVCTQTHRKNVCRMFHIPDCICLKRLSVVPTTPTLLLSYVYTLDSCSPILLPYLCSLFCSCLHFIVFTYNSLVIWQAALVSSELILAYTNLNFKWGKTDHQH